MLMGKFTGKNLMEGLLLVIAITALVLSIIAMTKKCPETFADACYCGDLQGNECAMTDNCDARVSCPKSCDGWDGHIENPLCLKGEFGTGAKLSLCDNGGGGGKMGGGGGGKMGRWWNGVRCWW